MALRLLATILILLSTPVFAGVVFEFELVDVSDPAAEPDRINTSVEGERIRMDVKGPRGANADMIFIGDRHEMLAVDHDSQTYVLIDDATIDQISSQLSQLEAQMQEMLKDVPPEQRAAVEQMMKQQMPSTGGTEPVTEIRSTGESGEKNGYAAREFELYRDGRREKSFWVTDWDNIEGGRDAARAFQGMADFIQGLQDAMPDFAKSPAVGTNAYEHLEELGGFPVVTIDYSPDGNVIGESHLKGSKVASLNAAEFEAPAGYARKTLVQ
jgi:hypothetical protein